MACDPRDVSWNKPFLLQVAFAHGAYHSKRNLVKTQRFNLGPYTCKTSAVPLSNATILYHSSVFLFLNTQKGTKETMEVFIDKIIISSGYLKMLPRVAFGGKDGKMDRILVFTDAGSKEILLHCFLVLQWLNGPPDGW